MDIDIVVGALGIVSWGRRLIDGDGGNNITSCFLLLECDCGRSHHQEGVCSSLAPVLPLSLWDSTIQ